MDSSSDSDEDNNIKTMQRTNNIRINFNIDNFQDSFRLTRVLAENILRDIAPNLEYTSHRNNALTPEQQFLITLRYFASNSHFQILGHAHGMHKSTVCRAIQRTIKALVDTFFQSVVSWPLDAQSRLAIANKFFNEGGFPSVAGAIDGSHIPIIGPKQDENQYTVFPRIEDASYMKILVRKVRLIVEGVLYSRASYI